jgi:hypothetical protein
MVYASGVFTPGAQLEIQCLGYAKKKVRLGQCPLYFSRGEPPNDVDLKLLKNRDRLEPVRLKVLRSPTYGAVHGYTSKFRLETF